MYLMRDSYQTDIPALPGGCSLSFSTSYTRLAATGTASGRRQYLIHGLNGSAADWGSNPFLSLANDFRAAGDELILLNLPAANACYFTNGGWQYREQFVSALSSITAAVETANGTITTNIIGGVSYGGLHAMLGKASNGLFKSWWAHAPVTRIDALSEFPSVGDVKRFNPFFDISSLADTTGLITWGTADTRVNYTLTVSLAGSFGDDVTKIAYSGQDHSTNSTNVADIAAWAATQ